ncbi:MAG: hypothetical protein ABR541_02875 [Candidatus Dormibacteria bacterium]
MGDSGSWVAAATVAPAGDLPVEGGQGMTRQRGLAAALFTAVIVAVLGVIAYSSYEAGSYRQQVYVLRHDVVAGGVVSDGDLAPETMRAEPGQLRTVETRGLATLIGRQRYLIELHRDDVLRQDDTAASAALAAVPVNIAIGGAVLSAGDSVDVYAEANGATLLLGRHLRVLAMGNPALLAVDPGSSAYWVALSFSTTRLAAVRSTDGPPPGTGDVTTAQALCALSGSPGCGAQPSASR